MKPFSRRSLRGTLTALVAVILPAAAACSSEVLASAPNPDGKKEGLSCADDSECQSLTCVAGSCAPVTGGNPKDKEQNGTETDVDCGGTSAPKCEDGKACKAASDCASATCTRGKCAEAKPDDGIKNGDESDVDCGGSKAPKCPAEKACASDGDCASGGCSYAKKCAEYPSCTRHFGGDTCGEGETGAADAKHESCCTTVTNKSGLKIGKYHVTAGRMRAFIERYSGNLQTWAATSPKGWNASWTSELPTSVDEAHEELGGSLKAGCSVSPSGKGGRTYWQPPIGDDKSDFPQDALDEKALNCVPWHMAQALCVSDGGRLASRPEIIAIMTNNGANTWPWQFKDKSPYDPESGWDDRTIHNYSYETPNVPANIRLDGDGPLDRSFYIAPPGRRPSGANADGIQDAVGNVLPWVNEGPNRFAWTMSWEEHPTSMDPNNTKGNLWPENRSELSQQVRDSIRDGYYALGARCVFQ